MSCPVSAVSTETRRLTAVARCFRPGHRHGRRVFSLAHHRRLIDDAAVMGEGDMILEPAAESKGEREAAGG